MKVLMFGWEFPPFFAGGVGIVCEALSRALAGRGEEVTFMMPAAPGDISAADVDVVVASQVAPGLRTVTVRSLLQPYMDAAEYQTLLHGAAEATAGGAVPYGGDLLREVERFAARAVEVIDELDLRPDVIHAHDWTTFPAGLVAAAHLGCPLVAHVHITEFDKSGGTHADPRIYAIERDGMHGAAAVVAVSNRLRERCISRYGVTPERIHVIHNGVARGQTPANGRPGSRPGKLVLFLGRVTLQKGPDHFVEAARRVLDVDPDVTFVLAGTGDMLPRLIERSAEAKIGSRMLFTGFVERERASWLYEHADVFVMPSVSEPFGIVALEAMERGVPVVLSRQSGVSEVVQHALKADFWDVDDMADKILAALNHGCLRQELARGADREIDQLSWANAADRFAELYRALQGTGECRA